VCGAVERILLICAFEEGYKDTIDYFVNFIPVHKLFHNHIRMIYTFTSIALKKLTLFQVVEEATPSIHLSQGRFDPMTYLQSILYVCIRI
jgi:hypothetical protein